MSEPPDQQDEEESRRREADRLQSLITEYRCRCEGLNDQCEAIEARIQDLESDSLQEDPFIAIPLLQAELDKLDHRLAEALEKREQRRKEVEREKGDLGEQVEKIEQEIRKIGDGAGV